MSKRDLKKYLDTLTKSQMQEQLLDLYTRFKEVKVFYDFAFNPKEDKLLEDAKVRITKEYNLYVRKAKMRRSVAHKLIKHFKKIEVQPDVIADLMLFNLEIAQVYSAEKRIRQESFYVSMLNSFREAVDYVKDYSLDNHFRTRLERIADDTHEQKWFNREGFELVIQKLE